VVAAARRGFEMARRWTVTEGFEVAAGEAYFFDQCRRQVAEVRFELDDDRGVGKILGLDRIDERNPRLQPGASASTRLATSIKAGVARC
jgi:hypothetical protein